MAAVLLGDRIAAKIKPGDLGSTFGGGPVACAAHLAVLDTIERENLVAHAETLGEAMHQQLCVGPVEAVLGRGCLIGLRVRGDAKALHRRLMDRGFITGTSANPQVLRLMPPINTPLRRRGAAGSLAAALNRYPEGILDRHETLSSDCYDSSPAELDRLVALARRLKAGQAATRPARFRGESWAWSSSTPRCGRGPRSRRPCCGSAGMPLRCRSAATPGGWNTATAW